jgi:hypothetical protein
MCGQERASHVVTYHATLVTFHIEIVSVELSLRGYPYSVATLHFSVKIVHRLKFYHGAFSSQYSLRNMMAESVGVNICAKLRHYIHLTSYFL